ncbi:monofunctional biosynthetic peptidoglycantransglycosylase [Bradyrhizobium diazoefficiens]|uniref:Monofunctional biosynthetic peptidoglycantransglycosylase n=1 Tax=Bradyrhizobium diazoefficiens TaxID=1355477 RepID=A0A0E4BNG4_9BRAD|nr:monofunctional biosynthetic peptidoglycantransglycosylase [Bradyrhizobium diazoefficiens]
MRIVKILLVALAVVVLAPYVIAPFYRTGHPVSTLMAWRSLRGAPMQREWIDLAAMSPYLPRSVVAAEDAHFCKHHGIDWGALREAIDDAKEDGTAFRAPPPSPSRWRKTCSSGRAGLHPQGAGIPAGVVDRFRPAQAADPGNLPQHRRARSAGPVWGGGGQCLCVR